MALTAADVARMSPAAQKQIAAKLVGEAQRKERKYRNEPTVSHGITFDSKKEARRYEELLLMLKAGTIRRLKLQVDFTLQEAYTTPEGERVHAMRYRADFAYERPYKAGRGGRGLLDSGRRGRQEQGDGDGQVQAQEKVDAGEIQHHGQGGLTWT